MTTTTQTKTQVRFTADEFKSMEWIIGEHAHMWYHSTDFNPCSSNECDDIIKQAKNYSKILTKLFKKNGSTEAGGWWIICGDLITETQELKIKLLKEEKAEEIKEEAKVALIEKQKS